MPERYEEGTYLHEFTEAAPKKATPKAPPVGVANTRAVAVGIGVGIFNIIAGSVVGGLALLLALAAFPFGLCLSIPLAIGALYLIGAIGGAVLQVAGGDALVASRPSPKHLWGRCPYCGHPRGAKRKEGDRLACGRCLNLSLKVHSPQLAAELYCAGERFHS
jgi:hypothetical protein